MTAPVAPFSGVLPPLPRKNIFRYLGMGRAAEDPAVAALVDECLPDFLDSVHCRGCYTRVAVRINGKDVDFDAAQVSSASLSRHLAGCAEAILFAATLGPQADLQRRRAAVTSPAKALVLDAMGSAAFEAFCDLLCEEWAKNNPALRLRPRFSPGYGDLPLSFQKELLALLDSGRKAGITLSSALLMVPQKSVSAIVGMGQTGCAMGVHNCADCSKEDCAFRL